MSASKRDPKCLFRQQKIQPFHCLYILQTRKIQKLPITLTAEEKDKRRAGSMSCVNKLSTHSIIKINQTISNIYIVSDRCPAQFRSKFVFNILIFFQKDVSLEWHYNQTHHEKGPMDGIVGTIKNLICRVVWRCCHRYTKEVC